jgi:NAD(P)-dependent dehydrogenase (short-subunit alcohol dehydrogenase family)
LLLPADSMASQHPFAGKVIAITGAASGIGLATAHYLAQRGASLSLADVQQNALVEAEKAIKKELIPTARVLTKLVDVRNNSEVEEWTAETVKEFGKLDGAANLAGVFIEPATGIKGIDDKIWETVLGINLTGLMNCLRAQLKVISRGGSIVTASSVAGLVGSGQYPAYTTSKHGVIGLTKCAAREMGDAEVRVNCICPYVSPIYDPIEYCS